MEFEFVPDDSMNYTRNRMTGQMMLPPCAQGFEVIERN